MSKAKELFTATAKCLSLALTYGCAYSQASPDAALGAAALGAAGAAASGVLGNAVYDLINKAGKKPGEVLLLTSQVELAGEALRRALGRAAEQMPDGEGAYILRDGLRGAESRWHDMVTRQLAPELDQLTVAQLCAAPTLEDFSLLAAHLTTPAGRAKSTLDDPALATVGALLMEEYPKALRDALTDPEGEKLYKLDLLGLVSGNRALLEEILWLLRGQEGVVAPPKTHISISRLPKTGKDLFGRDKELALLDEAWENPQTNVVIFVAWGGVGKSSLVNKWLAQLARDNWRGSERVFAWSFYSQGTSERAASADLFIDAALRWFGDPDPTAGGPWEKGERLAGYVRRQRTLLILDGLEPLQHPPGTHEGRLKDPALATLLEELAASQPGLCVVTTRERVDDVAEYFGGTAIEKNLENLTASAGAAILRSQGVTGDDAELEAAATELRGHAFSLTLLGSYVKVVLGRDIQRRGEIPDLLANYKHGEHAKKLMRAYEKWLGEGVPLSVLRLLGLFDRPAAPEAVAALRRAPAIAGLTDALQDLPDIAWPESLDQLRGLRLLADDTGDTLDAHPLVREYFKQQLKTTQPDAWQAANGRLYEHYQKAAPDLPATTDEMAPLYAAVAHGCEAGRHQEALDEVYKRRIQRDGEFFSTKKLGAFHAELTSLSSFFELPWQQVTDKLTVVEQAFVFSEVGFNLRALGRLKEAERPLQAALEIYIACQKWKNAAIAARYRVFGDLQQALEFAKQSVELAKQSGDWLTIVVNQSTLASILHRMGDVPKAYSMFRKAEKLQRQFQPEYPNLYSWWSFPYGDLLLAKGQFRKVKARISAMLDQTPEWYSVLDIALDNLLMGRVSLIEAQRSSSGNYKLAINYLNQAVAGLRQAGQIDDLPHGLLARAELRRMTSSWEAAQHDLDEVARIAMRSEMALYLTDARLEQARLALAQGDLARKHASHEEAGKFYEEARKSYEQARDDVASLGYHRRDAEVAELARQLGATD